MRVMVLEVTPEGTMVVMLAKMEMTLEGTMVLMVAEVTCWR